MCFHWPSTSVILMFLPSLSLQTVELPKGEGMNILHPKFGVYKKNRQGYDESMGTMLSRSCSAKVFIDAEDPVTVLTEYNTFKFEDDCADILAHEATTEEIKFCCEDLKVLNKGDFKALLKWRLKILQWQHEQEEQKKAAAGEESEEEEEKEPLTAEELEAQVEESVNKEIYALRLKELQKKKREKKKKAKLAAKERMRIAYGMDAQSFDASQPGVFSVKNIKNAEALKVTVG